MKNRPNIGNVFQWTTVGIALGVMYDGALGNLFKKGD